MKNNNKKGQITVFIIIGIILLFIIGAAFVLMSLLNEGNFKNINNADSSLKASIQECFKMTGEEALKSIGMQGRIASKSFFTYQNTNVYYASDNLITKEEMQNEISVYISENLKKCTEPIFNDFRKRGLIISQENPEAETTIAVNDLTIKLNYPVEFTLTATNNEKRNYKEFIESFNVRLGKLIEISEKIVKDNKEKPNMINMTYLDSLDVNTVVIPYEDATLFILEDKNSRIRNMNYAYSFAVK